MLTRCHAVFQECEVLRLIHSLLSRLYQCRATTNAEAVRISFGDESCVSQNGLWIYAMGFVSLDESDLDFGREYVRTACMRPELRYHFHDESEVRRAYLVRHVALGPWSITSAWKITSAQLQERSRRLLLAEMSAFAIEAVWVLESRDRASDRRDLRLFDGLRGVPDIARPRIEHVRADVEPLLWAADVVASSAARAGLRGLPAPFEAPSPS
jgi:hypothetical protein